MLAKFEKNLGPGPFKALRKGRPYAKTAKFSQI